MTIVWQPWMRVAALGAAGCAGAALLLAVTSFYLRRAQAPGSLLAVPALAWTTETLPAPVDLRAVWLDPTGEAFAVGDHGAIMRRAPLGTWSKVSSPTTEHLHAIAAGSQAVRLYAVGDHGVVLACARDSGIWSVEKSATTEHLFAIAACPGGHCAAGARGTLLRRNDETGEWKASDTRTTADLHGVAGWVSAPPTASSPASIATFVVGDRGTVLVQKVPFGRGQPAPSAWTIEDSHTSENLTAVTFFGDLVIAVGARGTVLRRDLGAGDRWTGVAGPADEPLRDLRVLGAAEPKLLIAAETAVYEHRFPDTLGPWTRVALPSPWGLDADEGRAIAVGEKGMVRHAALPARTDE